MSAPAVVGADAAPDPSMDPSLYRVGPDNDVSLLGSRSDATGATFWPPRLRCPQTGGTVSDVVLASSGTVWSWTYVHARWSGVQAPSSGGGYAAGLIDIDQGGPRVIGVLLGEQADWAVGLRVRAVPLVFRQDGNVLRSILAFEVAS